MKLDRIDFFDIRQPDRLAKAIHTQMGDLVLPVPVEDIATALDISEVRTGSFDGFEGMLLTDQARSIGAILANTRGGFRRARFTIAHELGHFLLEHHVLSSEAGFRCRAQDLKETREGRRHQKQETQANQFAIGLLAPVKALDEMLSSEPDLQDAVRLCVAFDISVEACVRRMIERRPEPLAAVWSKDGQVRYWDKNNGFPFVQLRKGDRLPQTTQAFRVHASSKSGFTDFSESPPMAWTSRDDIEIFEQTRRSPSGHAVTLLWADTPGPDDLDEEPDPYHRELGEPGFR
ncbi:ImmA/IrrE family metallo-endopeptidase [Roseovarius sp. B08]|uniref:ImmA/IrrE family metallo-endopeptidase n=1 Tax=Roseovarius sp. B08 TaxID=3449223 RepID=UPI003EDB885D